MGNEERTSHWVYILTSALINTCMFMSGINLLQGDLLKSVIA